MKNYTDITVLLDRSGSMQSCKEAMETAFNTFLQEHKGVPSTRITLVQFDDRNDNDMVYGNVPIWQAEPLKLTPRGNTPLLDALCKVIDQTGQRYSRFPEYARPERVLMVVITDGQENASRQYTRRDVFDRVNRQQDTYKWQFIYLGANQDAFAEAASFGIPRYHTINYDISEQAIGGVMRGLTSNTVAYANTGDTKSLAFNDDQRESAVDSKTQTTSAT